MLEESGKIVDNLKTQKQLANDLELAQTKLKSRIELIKKMELDIEDLKYGNYF